MIKEKDTLKEKLNKIIYLLKALLATSFVIMVATLANYYSNSNKESSLHSNTTNNTLPIHNLNNLTEIGLLVQILEILKEAKQ